MSAAAWTRQECDAGKTNEREGTRAVLRHARVSPYKVREVLDLVRGKPVHEAEDILRFSERDAAFTVGKVLHSAVANAENNDELDPEELYVLACFADEGTTIKRWRPRARGRATRIRKRTCHITVIVSRMPEEELQRQQARRRAEQLAQRARRVAGARRAEGDQRSRAERRHGGPPPRSCRPREPPTADERGGRDGGGAEAETAEARGEPTEAERTADETPDRARPASAEAGRGAPRTPPSRARPSRRGRRRDRDRRRARTPAEATGEDEAPRRRPGGRRDQPTDDERDEQ